VRGRGDSLQQQGGTDGKRQDMTDPGESDRLPCKTRCSAEHDVRARPRQMVQQPSTSDSKAAPKGMPSKRKVASSEERKGSAHGAAVACAGESEQQSSEEVRHRSSMSRST
jgi:hypothetical protein